MDNLTKFSNEMFGTIRTLDINGDPYFVGKDVATALGYQNASKAIQDHVDPEDKLNNASLSSLGQRGGWLINESGVYSLVFASKLPTAKEFKHWVTSEVLPSIRRHGAYTVRRAFIGYIGNFRVIPIILFYDFFFQRQTEHAHSSFPHAHLSR